MSVKKYFPVKTQTFGSANADGILPPQSPIFQRLLKTIRGWLYQIENSFLDEP